MVKSSDDQTIDSRREHTDASLHDERAKADAAVAEELAAAETKADAAVERARQRADEVVHAAREMADQAVPAEAAAKLSTVLAKADEAVAQERAKADDALDQERAQRRRVLDQFLASEREATDHDLIDERSHADTVVAARDELLATVSHDLRSLLGSLALNAELLLTYAPEGDSGANIRRHAATSRRLVARMTRLVSDLLDVACIEAGRLSLSPERVEVTKILLETIDAFEQVALAKEVKLRSNALALPPLYARFDGGRIVQVLANLVSNALRVTPPQGVISLQVTTTSKAIRFSVTDTGVGIPEASLQSVFERFGQVRKGNHGLGLHISKSIVEAHGGKIWVESQPGQGSTFYFELPSSLVSEPASRK